MALDYQIHHVIPLIFGNNGNPVIDLLSKSGLFDLNDVDNLTAMPSDPALARALDISVHNGGHLSSYTKGVTDFLDGLEASTDFGAAAFNGDQSALQRL